MVNEKVQEKVSDVGALQGFQVALAFLTQFPVGRHVPFHKDAIRKSFYFYPLVGFIIGCLAYVAALLLPFSFFLNSALIVFLLVLSTGGLHLDGLADCTDAWFGGIGDTQKTLLIMKDSQAGAMAVVAVSLLLIVKTAAVYEVLNSQNYLLLLLAPMFSRLSVLGLFMSTSYVGEGIIGKALATANGNILYAIIVICIIISFALVPDAELTLLISIVLLAVFFLRSLMVKRLSGFTGDCAGAQIELIEVLALVGGCLVLP